jgi:hypothetical protein
MPNLYRQGINSYGGVDYAWDGDWRELGSPLGNWLWGDSVVVQDERKYLNVCRKCGKPFWYTRLIAFAEFRFCDRCQAEESEL